VTASRTFVVRSPTPPTPAGVGDNDRPEDENAKQLATPGEPNCNTNQQVKAIENSKSNKAVAIVTTLQRVKHR